MTLEVGRRAQIARAASLMRPVLDLSAAAAVCAPGCTARLTARADLVLVSGKPLTDITATRAIERIWRAGTACDRHAFVASAAEAEQLDAFDAQVAKAVAAVRERWSHVDPRNVP